MAAPGGVRGPLAFGGFQTHGDGKKEVGVFACVTNPFKILCGFLCARQILLPPPR